MEKALGLHALGEYEAAISEYNTLIEKEKKEECLLNRGIAFCNQGNFTAAYEDLSKYIASHPNHFYSLYWGGISAFNLSKFSEAMANFLNAEKVAENEKLKKKAMIWTRRATVEVNNNPYKEKAINVPGGKASESQETPARKAYEWSQTDKEVIIDIFIKDLKENNVELIQTWTKIIIKISKDKETELRYSFTLCSEILPESTEKKFEEFRFRIILKKKLAGISWRSLEKESVNVERPNYPSSSKNKKNWDKIDVELSRELDREKPEGDEAFMKLMKEIYSKGDEEKRKAMIKSFQTSGGTVLSTNWDEVKHKDYEKKDRPDPPDGQKWVKPEY